MSLVIERVAANVSAKPRHDTMEGKDYLVVPAVIMVEGVLNGSHGPIMYTAENMALNAWAWNYRPVVVTHPQKNGQYVPVAVDADEVTSYKVGVLMNTEFIEGTKGEPAALHSECWIDIDRVQLIDNRILEAIEQGQMLELSTGLVSTDVEERGKWNGDEYTAIATNIIPDHLAILPDDLGACSIEDGCGFMRVNTVDGEVLVHPKADARRRSLKRFEAVWANTLHEMSFTQIHNELWLELGKKFGDKGITWNGWVEDVYDDYVVYSVGGETFKHDYTPKKKSVKLTGKPKEVQRVVEYEPVTNAKELAMSKDVMVDALIANDQTEWAETDRDWLSGLEEGILEKLNPKKQEKVPDKKENVAVNTCCPATATLDGDKFQHSIACSKPEEKPKTNQAYIDELPLELRDVMNEGLLARNEKRGGLVEAIKANEANPFTDEQLAAKTTSDLSALAVLASSGIPEQEADMVANYVGSVGFAQTSNTAQEPLLVPIMKFGKEAEKVA